MANKGVRPPKKADRAPKRKKGDDKPPSPDGGADKSMELRKRGLILCIVALPVLVAFYVVLLYWSNPHTGGRELRIDQYITLLRQGRIQSATILESDNRIAGKYDRGNYWVAVAAGRE